MISNEFSFIIVTHQNSSALKRILQSCHCQDYKKFEIIVVSNFYEESSARLANAYSAKYTFSNGVGVNRARNLGLDTAETSFVYFLDDDCCLPDNQFGSRLAEKLLNSSQFIGGPYKSTQEMSAASRAYIETQNQWLQSGRLDGTQQYAFLLGGNCGGPTALFRKFRFDDEIVYGGSETEMFLRAAQAGINCICYSDLCVVHHCEVEFWDITVKAFKQARGKAEISKRRLYFEPAYYTSHKVPFCFYRNWYEIVFRGSLLLRNSPGQILKQVVGIGIIKLEHVRRNIIEKVIAVLDIFQIKN